MGWDKNTIVTSKIEANLQILKAFGAEFTLTELGEVRGLGLNDIGDYLIRLLEFKDLKGELHRVVEQMQRAHDCDMDDVLVSYSVDADYDVSKHQLAIYMPDLDYPEEM